MAKKQRQRIVVGINSLVSTTQPAYSNHIQLFYRLGRNYPNIDFCLVNPPRMSIDRMRNLCAMTAMEIEASHLLFIDDDVLIPTPFDFLHKLLACKVPIAAADVIIRGYPFNHMLFKYTKDKKGLNPLKEVPAKLGQIPVDAVGFSCCLIETAIIKKVNPPYFITGVSNTEDIYFCMKVRQKFPECKFMADTSIQCGHILSADVIEPGNLVNYRKYYKNQFKLATAVESNDRGQAYYNLVKAAK
jgi:hypothetical protein